MAEETLKLDTDPAAQSLVVANTSPLPSMATQTLEEVQDTDLKTWVPSMLSGADQVVPL